MVYVGNLEFPYKRMLMSHMMADTEEELHLMADKIGVARKWYQNHKDSLPHYDICKSKKLLAISFGAEQVTDRWLVTHFKLSDKLKENGKRPDTGWGVTLQEH